jgi:hypothetical protein
MVDDDNMYPEAITTRPKTEVTQKNRNLTLFQKLPPS